MASFSTPKLPPETQSKVVLDSSGPRLTYIGGEAFSRIAARPVGYPQQQARANNLHLRHLIGVI